MVINGLLSNTPVVPLVQADDPAIATLPRMGVRFLLAHLPYRGGGN